MSTLPAARDFQTDSRRIDERKPPLLTRATLYSLVLVIAVAGIWMSLARVDRIVVAPGRLITTAPSVVVQPLQTAVVHSLKVQVGEIVKKGQVLATLDPTFSEADAARLRDRAGSLRAQIDRLRAEIADQPYRATVQTSDTRIQETIWLRRSEEIRAKLDAYDQQIHYVRAQIATAEADHAALKAQLAAAEELESMRATLLQKKLDSKINFLQAQGQRLQIDRQMELATHKAAELKKELDRLKAEKVAYLARNRQNTAEELVKVQRDYDSVRKQLEKADRASALTVLIAPEDSVVLDMAKLSIGSVAKEAEPIYTLVPLNSPLEADVRVDGRDVGHVKIGEDVKIKLAAWPFQDHGTLEGKVRTVSDDSFAPGKDGTGAPFYRARIALTTEKLHAVPPSFRLIPGMQVTAEVKAGDRTVLSYFLYPLMRGIDESIREP